MEQEYIFKITMIATPSEIKKGGEIISQRYGNHRDNSYIYLSPEQMGLNLDNIFDLDEYSSLILAKPSAIEHFALIFITSGIRVEYFDFENKFYYDFDINSITPIYLKNKMINHMASKLSFNHTIIKIIDKMGLNEIDYILLSTKFIS
jgi:hypothetical protein